MKLPIITIQDIQKHNPRSYVIYSDNILESTNILDLLSSDNSFLDIIGVSYEPIDQPIYLFKDRDSDLYIAIKVAGKYENWDLPENVNSLIHYIDKPDFVIIDTGSGEAVFVGETTGTANVGNSQWQREGRKISAALNNTPMIYQTYYSGSDRSMFEQKEIDTGAEKGVVREPSSLQVINHFIYSIRYKTPSLLIYYPNSEYDLIIEHARDDTGRELLKHYISISLLYNADKKHKTAKKELEFEIYTKMLEFISEEVPHRSTKIQRMEKDFPVEPALTILKDKGPDFIGFLVDYINNDTAFKVKFDLSKWDYRSFSPWHNRYANTRLISLMEKAGIVSLSYINSASKAGFVVDTLGFIKFLDLNYPHDRGKFIKKLNPEIPTLIIPTLMFQKKDNGYIYKVDPGTGEIVAFSELFARNIKNEKSMNVIIYVHVKGPDDFSTNTKLFRAIKRYSDCLIINEKIYEY